MHTTRHVLMLAAFLSALFLSATTANAQLVVNYHFLEVSDADGKPVADAKVAPGDRPDTVTQTDERGRATATIYGGYRPHSIKVSKPGYLPYEAYEIYDRNTYWELYDSLSLQYDAKAPVKVVLLKEPATAAERKAVEAELRRRELVRAVKAHNVAGVEKLLRDGVSPDAADFEGIPAVLFASANGDGEMIKALLAAGADVRNKGKPGRNALLYYVRRTRVEGVDVETVRRLIKAGADVKAADKHGMTVLGIAEQSHNPELVKLLEKAGAR